MRYGIAVDLGGTNIKIVAVSEEGQMLERSSCETQTDSPGSWIKTIRQRIKEIENDQPESARWIGLAAPGLAARDNLSIASMQESFGDSKDSIGQTLCRPPIKCEC